MAEVGGMELYPLALFAHIAAAVVLVGSSLIGPVLTTGVARARTVDGLRQWAGLTRRIVSASEVAAPITLLAGVYLAFAGDWWGQGWVAVSLAVFLVMGGVATIVMKPFVVALHERTVDAPDGPIDAELEELRHNPRIEVLEWLFIASDLTIIFLMTNKPGYPGSLATLAVAYAVAAGVVLAKRRRLTGPRAQPTA